MDVFHPDRYRRSGKSPVKGKRSPKIRRRHPTSSTSPQTQPSERHVREEPFAEEASKEWSDVTYTIEGSRGQILSIHFVPYTPGLVDWNDQDRDDDPEVEMAFTKEDRIVRVGFLNVTRVLPHLLDHNADLNHKPPFVLKGEYDRGTDVLQVRFVDEEIRGMPTVQETFDPDVRLLLNEQELIYGFVVQNAESRVAEEPEETEKVQLLAEAEAELEKRKDWFA
ncbi:hypothetical protein BC832DRAFT_563261 [Gaertneriomyces semiglobifer]|nr:hypothetical protein BC832DRAFT_563261 [Gaertneriomyces semiglobifer]